MSLGVKTGNNVINNLEYLTSLTIIDDEGNIHKEVSIATQGEYVFLDSNDKNKTLKAYLSAPAREADIISFFNTNRGIQQSN